MNEKTFVKNVNREIRRLTKIYGVKPSQAFLIWLSTIALAMDEDEAFDAVQFDSPNDKGIDVFKVDHMRERILIVQGRYSDKGRAKAKERDVSAFLNCTHWLENPEALEREGRSDLAEAAREYLDAVKQGYSIELWYVHFGPGSPNVEKIIRVWNSSEENFSRGRSCRYADINLLCDMYQEQVGKRVRVAEATLHIHRDQAYTQVGEYGEAVVASIDALELAQLYKTYGDKLFDRNVRLFLGTRRGSVNAVIADTIENPVERESFWAYNNGITIVCDSFDLNLTDETLTLRNFSVVNGCQTTVLLASGIEHLTPGVQVLVKIVSPTERQIDSILQFTNSQNQIRAWDIRSQDKTQLRLKRQLAALEYPYYYALRRGEIRTLTTEERRKFTSDGRMRTIAYDRLGQYLGAFKGMPLIAYRNKAQLFAKHYDKVFPADIRVEEVLFVWRAAEAMEEEVLAEIGRATEREDEQTIRILKRGGKIYSLATLAMIAELRNGPNYLVTINEERISSQGAAERLRKYCKLSVLWYRDIVKEFINVRKEDLNVLLRSPNFVNDTKERLTSKYEEAKLGEAWFRDAIPKLF